MGNTGSGGTVGPPAPGGGEGRLGRPKDDAGEGGASFEAAQRELEQIVERLERGEVELDELTTLWERGEQLYRLCADQLSSAQGRIEELSRRGEER